MKEKTTPMPDTNSFKYILSTIKASFLPAVLFAFGLIMFYAKNPFSAEVNCSFHTAFYVISFCGLALLYAVNLSKPFFSFLCGTAAYLFINLEKSRFGTAFTGEQVFLWLCFTLPVNLLLFYFLPMFKLRTKQGGYLFLFVLAEAALVQHFGEMITQIPYVDVCLGTMPLWAAVLWGIVLVVISLDISFKNTVINTGLFYADCCLFMGLLYSDSVSGLTVFFLCFALVLCCSAFLELYHRYNYDVLENVGSYNSYLVHAASKFPYKYTIGLFSIDNRDKLLKVIGACKMQELEQMLVNRIRQFPYDLSVYRYVTPEELIMVFKNEDAKHTMEFVDNIRHVIAASEFVFTSGKTIKITISVSVSEKTRLDLDATSVTARAHSALQRAYRFNCNIVTKA